jgi:hypothetical protein
LIGRFPRAALALIAFLTLATPIAPGPEPGPGVKGSARLFAAPVPLNPDRPGERRLGPLLYSGGWVLSSDDRRFGAISAMSVEGGRVIALSDRGTVFGFTLPVADGAAVQILPLSQGPGATSSKADRDSESLAVTGAHAWVGYENSNQIWRFRLGDWTAAARAAPPAMGKWPANVGAEAIVRLPDGRFLVLAEHLDEDGNSAAILFGGDPAERGTPAIAARYRPPGGHRITDAALLPNGRLILLSRGFTVRGGWSAKLLTAELPGQAGQLIRTFEVATLAAPLTVDNMEALAVTVERERTILWIASDDNLIPLQRTLLMKFELAE